jgi:Na+/melibiose symporter-like transporter
MCTRVRSESLQGVNHANDEPAYFAKRWLDRNHLEFPWALLRVALTSITVAAVCILSMVAFQKQIILILAMSLIANCFVAFVYYRNLPPLAVAKVHAMFRRRR